MNGVVILDDGRTAEPGENERFRKHLDESVPVTPPYGSITDEDHECARCGQQLTGCALCAGMRVVIRRRK